MLSVFAKLTTNVFLGLQTFHLEQSQKTDKGDQPRLQLGTGQAEQVVSELLVYIYIIICK